jgi:hypothetical protein
MGELDLEAPFRFILFFPVLSVTLALASKNQEIPRKKTK